MDLLDEAGLDFIPDGSVGRFKFRFFNDAPQIGTQQFTTFAWIHLESPEYSPQEVKVRNPNSLEVCGMVNSPD